MKSFTIAAALLLSSIHHSSEAAAPKLRANLKNGASTAAAEIEMIESKSAVTEVAYEYVGTGYCRNANNFWEYTNSQFANGKETLSECKGKCECALGVAGVELRGFFFRTIATGDSHSSQCICYVVEKVAAVNYVGKCDVCWGRYYGSGGSGEITNSDGGDGTCYRKKV